MERAVVDEATIVWCKACGIPYPAATVACDHCGRRLDWTNDVASPDAVAPAGRPRPIGLGMWRLPVRRGATHMEDDIEATAAAIVARARELDITYGIVAPPDQLAAPALPPAAFPALLVRDGAGPTTVTPSHQLAWLLAGLVLCVLLVAFALLVARDAAGFAR